MLSALRGNSGEWLEPLYDKKWQRLYSLDPASLTGTDIILENLYGLGHEEDEEIHAYEDARKGICTQGGWLQIRWRGSQPLTFLALLIAEQTPAGHDIANIQKHIEPKIWGKIENTKEILENSVRLSTFFST